MNTHQTIHQDTAGQAAASSGTPHVSPAELERDIDRQRGHIGDILNALESKLSPGELFERVISSGKDGGREFASNLGETLKANPMPTLLAAAGLAWLYASNGNDTARNDATRDIDDEGDDRSGIRARAGHAREGITEKFSDARDRAGDATHDAVDAARRRARQVNNRFHDLLEDNPMAVGAMGVAVGALLGAMLPSTDKEDELLGETSEDLVDKGTTLAKQGFDRAADVARDVATPRPESHQSQGAPYSAGHASG